ncbi:hypothetical protein [Streptomyces litmocidini]|uniref:hypothetical protein n=1 Tax=Streptomyces litmocidini TaxID=67318 RepID=UPI00167E24C4|nr:hypothetical protein [Streptomyces litmocidini]
MGSTPSRANAARCGTGLRHHTRPGAITAQTRAGEQGLGVGRAAERGEHPCSDPVAQMLSAALVCTQEHQAVRDRLGEIGRG